MFFKGLFFYATIRKQLCIATRFPKMFPERELCGFGVRKASALHNTNKRGIMFKFLSSYKNYKQKQA